MGGIYRMSRCHARHGGCGLTRLFWIALLAGVVAWLWSLLNAAY
jgi:hypothetical protein